MSTSVLYTVTSNDIGLHFKIALDLNHTPGKSPLLTYHLNDDDTSGGEMSKEG
jgi:hypothetical protein